MKLTHTLFLTFAGLLCVGCHVNAQRSRANTPRTQPDYTVIIKREFRSGGVTTLVSLERMFITVRHDEAQPIGFSSMFVYDEKSKAVAAGYISFYSTGPNCRFPLDSPVTFMADGEEINFISGPQANTKTDGSASVFSEVEGSRCNESVNVIVPQPKYSKIANAMKVDVRVGRQDFSLEDNHLKALRELAQMMAQPNL